MTTFTSEDRENASPPHIIDSGASVKTLGEYIELEGRIEMYREQIQILQAEIQRRKRRMMEAGIDE
jgi:DNA/RNA endonuclease YhcR with UshA esterase domain